MRKTIIVDMDDIESMKKAERQKWKCECEGYRKVSDKAVGLSKFVIVYEK